MGSNDEPTVVVRSASIWTPCARKGFVDGVADTAEAGSQTDPPARWTSAPGGPAYYAYSTNYLVDTKAGVIIDVEATPANRVQKVAPTKLRSTLCWNPILA